MKLSHKVTLVILVSIVISAILSIVASNWGELAMCITALGGWSMVAKQEQLERKANEALSG